MAAVVPQLQAGGGPGAIRNLSELVPPHARPRAAIADRPHLRGRHNVCRPICIGRSRNGESFGTCLPVSYIPGNLTSLLGIAEDKTTLVRNFQKN